MSVDTRAPDGTGAFNVLWLQSGGCGGCNMSLLCADTPDFSGMLSRAGIRLLWHPSLSLETGADARDVLLACLDGTVELHALCVEGAMLRG
ncbi:HupU protein, partial [Burkholderia vietnamiensis]